MNTTLYPHPGGAIIERAGLILTPRGDFPCRVIARDGREITFSDAHCETGDYKTGVGKGFYCRYTDFPGLADLALETRVWIETATGDVRFDLIPLSDADISEALWPAPFDMDAPDGHTALPVMQGGLLDNYAGGAGRFDGPQWPCSRGMTMRFFAQYSHGGGYVMMTDTPFDTGLLIDAKPGASVRASFRSLAQLGRVGRERNFRLSFLSPGQDYNDAAAAYRKRIRAEGGLVTLREKIARNPRVAEYIGIPIFHTESYIHIKPESRYYVPDDPAHNDRLVTFDEVGEKLHRLKRAGVEKLCLHLDGWQKRGYDNLHPDALPPCRAAGGWEGLRRLKGTCRELGYFFGVHDQYRDYFCDCDSFDLENAARDLSGGYPEICVWYGGRQTVLCGKVALDYVRRNYNAMEAEGVLPDNAYLDVFSVVELDECDNPAHRMTRGECAVARAKCFCDVASRGVVLQSEEAVDWAVPYIDFVHHAPFALDQGYDRGHFIGRGIPLEYLVYHDCLIMPFFPVKGGFGVPDDVDGGLLSALYGCGTYIMENADERAVARMKSITDWQKKVQLRPMIRHEFLSPTRQMCVFEGSCTSTVDFETGMTEFVGGDA